jgi:hypothetical protein
LIVCMIPVPGGCTRTPSMLSDAHLLIVTEN